MGKKKNKPIYTGPHSPCMMSKLGLNPRAPVFYPRNHNASASPRSTGASTSSSSARKGHSKGLDTVAKIVDESRRGKEDESSHVMDVTTKTSHKRESKDYDSPKTPNSTCSTAISASSSTTFYSTGIPTPKAEHDPFASAAPHETFARSICVDNHKSQEANPSGPLLTTKEFDFPALDDFYSYSSRRCGRPHHGASTSTHRSKGNA